MKILVVDDNQDFAETLADVLELNGYSVTITFDREDAIKKFTEKDYILTFMDVKLPGMNGVESFLKIKKIKSKAKVIMMTGYSVEQLLNQAIENGALEVLYKPFDMKNVLKILERIKPDGIILIADDDEDFVGSIKTLLENEGYKVLVAQDGQKTIDHIRSNGIDLLILDIRLPLINGLEVYLELKKTGHILPTIIVTAYANEEINKINTFKSLMVTGILKKPFEPSELLKAVEEKLSYKKK